MKLAERKWFYPLVYFALVVISLLPLYTEAPYDPRDTQRVIMEILQVSIAPYAAWGWFFHVATLTVIALAVWQPQIGGRAIAAYFGLNYLIIAAVQTNAHTASYGFAVQTGALVAGVLLGLLWLWVAWKDRLRLSFKEASRWKWALAPFAVLVFWSPITVEGGRAAFNFDPLLLFTSPDYGLAYCFMTPVFLFLLILAHPNVDRFALRVTAFNGLIYGLFNLTHWFNPDWTPMGVMHLPLLVLPVAALIVSR